MPLSEETVGGTSPSNCYSHGKGGNYGEGQTDCSRVFRRQEKFRRCLCTYDANGNIATAGIDGKTPTYEYDDLGQLVWEKNAAAGKAWNYTYDNGGNILSRTEYACSSSGTVSGSGTTTSYTYGDAEWGDLLTAYDGEEITYDGIGNPLSYRGWTMSWQGGRQLSSMTKGSDMLSFAYNESGLRTSKAVNGVTHSYVWQGSKLAADITDAYALYLHYDSAGDVIGFTRTANGADAEYFYVKNLQGDILKVITATGTEAATYTYDAWGKLLTSTGDMADVNPLRYRGYYYDIETQLYYVSSRYYDPAICRFTSVDSVEALGANDDFASLNLFAYCGNSPVARQDDNGYLWANVLIGAVVGAVAGIVGQVISDAVTSAFTGELTISNWQTYAGAAIGGAAGGAVLAITGNVNAANSVTGAVTTGVGQSLEKLTIRNYNKSWAEIGANTLTDGVVSYGLGKLPGIKKYTAGRNSWSAVYKSGLTKLGNKTAARMSAKVIAKGLGSSAIGGLALDSYYGVKQFAYDRVKTMLS